MTRVGDLDRKRGLTSEELAFLHKQAGAIIHTDNYGFVHVEWYDSKKEFEKVWDDLEEDYEKFMEGAEESLMEITKIRGATGQQVYDRIEQELERAGYRISRAGSVNIRPTYISFTVEIETEKVGHNIHIGYDYKEKRINKLGWDDWVYVNNLVNNILDEMNVSANVQTLKGQFVIRRGTQRFSEDDWEDQKYRNVGSVVQPVSLVAQNQPAPERVMPWDYMRGVRVKQHRRKPYRRVK